MEASRAGKPGGEPVTDVYVFACLASISSSSGNGTQPIGKPFVSSCPFPSVGSRLMNSNLGTFMERLGRRISAERLVGQTDAPLRSPCPPRGGWLVQVHVKPAVDRHLLPAMQKLATWTSSSRETFPFCFYLPKSVFFPSEMKIAMKKEIKK